MQAMNIKEIEKIVKKRKPDTIGEYNYFSVLVPMVEIDGDTHLIYEIRASHMNTRPSEISFPGGRIEKGETKRQSAVRETCEELGLKKKQIKVIGEIDTLHAYSNFTIYSFLGIIDFETYQNAKWNPDEVDWLFTVPIKKLIENPPFIYNVDIVPSVGDFPYDRIGMKSYNWQHGSSQVPIYNVDGKIIWGLTARITKSFIDILK